MLHTTKGIVLRAVKYGDTSLVCTIFTALYGVQSYMVQGVRTSRSKSNKAAFFQPGTLLDMVVYHKPQVQLQRIKEYSSAYIYTHMHEHMVRNSVMLFAVELLLRILPESAPQPELFDFAYDFFCQLDVAAEVGNYPLYFIIQVSKHLGYELKGTYHTATPFLNIAEGGFTDTSADMLPVAESEAMALAALLQVNDIAHLQAIHITSHARQHLLDWYISFLQLHTQHMGPIRSLPVLHAVLH